MLAAAAVSVWSAVDYFVRALPVLMRDAGEARLTRVFLSGGSGFVGGRARRAAGGARRRGGGAGAVR